MAKELTYRTFDELLSAVLSDFKTFDQEGMIDPQDLIKVAQRVNKDLSVRIQADKNAILEVCKGKVRLPNDFYMLTHAMICGSYTVTHPVIHGIQKEQIVLETGCDVPSPLKDSDINTNCKPCDRPIIRVNECGTKYMVVQDLKYETRTYEYFHRLHIQPSKEVHPNCIGCRIHADRTCYIKAGWLYTNFEEGKIFLNYVGNMEDEEGNLLVLDHDIVNEYYEYAMKVRILENMLVSGEQVENLYKLFDDKRRKARIEARNIVGMPDFAELVQVWEMNRRAQYNKYFRMFESCSYYA